MFALIYQENGEPRRCVLSPGETVAGRLGTCNLVLDDASVSRRHAVFEVTDDVCTVTDVGSRNGVFLNGALVRGATLNDGDHIGLGRFDLTVERSAADRLSISEQHELIEEPGTIYRPVVDLGTRAGTEAGPSQERSLRLLADVARTLVRNRPLGEILVQVVNLAFDTCPAERAFLVLKDERSGALVPRIACRRDGTEIKSASLSRTIVNRVMKDRLAMLAADARVDARLDPSESLLAQDVRSFMCAPLWHEHDVIGILYVDASLTQRFSSTDLDLLTALSNFAAIAIEQARLAARIVEETGRRERLQRYPSPAVVSRILDAEAAVENAFLAQEREITVIFADIVGFTALSEQMAPAQTALLLNTFFGRMADVVFEYEGTLDKFIGDAVMAVFGAPLDQPDHAVRAARTALAMQAAIAKLNAESGNQPLQVRMGIHSGIALAGDIGSLKRREYTVLGDVVNTASRLESMVAKSGQIIISRATLDRLGEAFPVRPLGTQALRGRHAMVETFELIAADG